MSAVGMNRDLVGKEYEQAEPFEVTAAGAEAYAKATAADISAYVGQDAVAPPMYGCAFGFGAMTAPLFDNDLRVDMLRLVHGEQDMHFLQPVRAGDVIRSWSRILQIEEKENGEVLHLGLTSKNQHDVTVLEVKSGIFIKSPQKKRDRQLGALAGDDPFLALPQRFVSEIEIDADQSVRYAAASGDHNPIHTDEKVAQMAGLPGVILHGLCTMAMVHNVLVKNVLVKNVIVQDVMAQKGDDRPTIVERLRVRFARPVLMGDRLRVDVRGPEQGPFSIRVCNQDGTVVLNQGLAEVQAEVRNEAKPS